jgi:F-type H+-transporting ATPase subunit gamma
MPNAKEIRTQIKSVKSTQQITRAMEMVAASKMRKAQERMEATRPYADNLRTAVGHLTEAAPGYKHPFMVEREAKRVGYIVVSTDRGLCGALNINLFREVVSDMQAWQSEGVESSAVALGGKAMAFFRRVGGHVLAEASNLGDRPAMQDVLGAIKAGLDAYREGEVDRVFVAHNQFVNTMTQRPRMVRLLPTEPVETEHDTRWDYIYEPGPEALFDPFLTRYVEAQVYSAVRENIACEMAARMVAMKSASDNAGEIIDNLELDYNKARQAAITQELAEIVGGAAAV